MEMKRGKEERNGNKTFKRITNDDIYYKVMDIEDQLTSVLLHIRHHNKLIQWIWGAIGTMVLTFITYLFFIAKG